VTQPGVAALRARAEASLALHLERNAYPGRGLVVGRAGNGAWLLVYWIMGRSPASRGRRLVAEGAVLRTEPVGAAAPGDPSLLVYEAMLELPGVYLAGNGDQTRTLYDRLLAGGRFEDAVAACEREPDAPHYTPRLLASLDLRGPEPELALALLKASAADPARTDRWIFRPAPPPPGLGLGLTAYAGDGEPLPSYAGEPLWLPLGADADATLERYWGVLHAENRVALAVKSVERPGAPGRLRVVNRHGAKS
jgi:hypothetical protein